jgi:hypothetical protein
MHIEETSVRDEVIADGEAAYLHQRAEAELEQAQQASHPRAAAAHHQLAEAYLDRASALRAEDVGASRPEC